MPDITISPPALGTQAYFNFKNPVAGYIKNKLNCGDNGILLTVIGINNLKSLMEVELRDPFIDSYNPMGILKTEYMNDVLNEVPLYVFAYQPPGGKKVYIKSPLNYIADFSIGNDIIYTNRLVMLDLGKLPIDLDTVIMFDDLSDFVYDRFGIRPDLKEVSVGDPEKTTREDHALRQAIRTNSITVRKSKTAQFMELSHKYNQLINRLDELGIVLG